MPIFLSHIIHDWTEDQCLTILGNCQRAMNPGGRLLINFRLAILRTQARYMMMLVGPGGQERTEQEYGTLLSKAGLRLTRVVPTESPVSVVEASLA
jgi:hypothetical protein